MTYLPLCELINEDLLNNISKTIELTATVTPDNAFKGVIWSSSDETKATVDENGVVTGHQAGEVTITATSAEDETIKATSTITVKSHISQRKSADDCCYGICNRRSVVYSNSNNTKSIGWILELDISNSIKL